jgi:hypothetical protein
MTRSVIKIDGGATIFMGGEERTSSKAAASP